MQDKLYNFAKTVMPTSDHPGQGTSSLHSPALVVDPAYF